MRIPASRISHCPFIFDILPLISAQTRNAGHSASGYNGIHRDVLISQSESQNRLWGQRVQRVKTSVDRRTTNRPSVSLTVKLQSR